MAGRLCIICYRNTFGRHPLCLQHFREFKDEVSQAMGNKEEWFRYLETVTANETRKIRKESQLISHGEY